MTLAVSRTFRKPFWVTPFGTEGRRDFFSDRLWPELLRDKDEDLAPNIDFIEKEGKYFLNAELPGLKKDDISISIEDGYVTVSGKKEINKEGYPPSNVRLRHGLGQIEYGLMSEK